MSVGNAVEGGRSGETRTTTDRRISLFRVALGVLLLFGGIGTVLTISGIWTHTDARIAEAVLIAVAGAILVVTANRPVRWG